MLRLILTLLVASGLGYAIAQAAAKSRIGGVTERFELYRAGTSEKPDDQQLDRMQMIELHEVANPPRLVTPDGNDFDFGMMRHGTTMSRDFRVRNDGGSPLRMELIDSTCKCTVGKLESNVVEPGETVKINLTWTAQSLTDLYGQTATLKTNDPERTELKLTVHGRIVDSYVIMPKTIKLGAFPNTSSQEQEVYVFSYLEGAKEISNIRWSDEETADLVELNVEQVELDAEKFPSQANALVVHRIKFQLDSGLPLGPLDQGILFETDQGEDIGTLEVPVQGRVTGEISLIGSRAFNPANSVLNLGAFKSSSGAKTQLLMSIRGEGFADVDASIESVEPESLVVKLGKPKISESRKLIPIEFEVPKGIEPIILSGSGQGNLGKVTLKTTHKSLKEIPVYIRMSVSE